MNRWIALFLCLLLNTNSANTTQATLLPDAVVAALSQELSGETAKSNLEYIARFHRMRGSRGFHSAAEHIVKQLRDYGLTDARIEQFPADGKIFYGTQKSRQPWDAEFAGLWELRESDYFTDHYGEERESKLRLPGGEYAYEVLNLVDGRRTAQEIRDVVSAVYGPIPLDFVVEYLRALESIRVVEAVK